MPKFQVLLAGVVISLAVCGCASGADSQQHPPNSEIDTMNKDIQAINTAERQWRAAVLACPFDTRQQATTCLTAAYQSSGFPSAVADLRRQMEHADGSLDNGHCKTALTTFVTKLRALSHALDTFLKAPATGTRTDVKAAGHATGAAWAAAVRAQAQTKTAC